ncbi:hypothetical protein COCVIDRAFT_108646, partial [Bipolaris victoriae FI3]
LTPHGSRRPRRPTPFICFGFLYEALTSNNKTILLLPHQPIDQFGCLVADSSLETST